MTPNGNAVRSAMTAIVLVACAGAANTATAQTNKACGLLTATEIEAGLGFKSTLSPNSTGLGGCMGPTPTHHMVSVELKAARTPGPNDEATFIQFMKTQGVQAEFKKFGSTTCWTGTAQKADVAFGTSCAITKGAQTAIISVTAGSAKEMVPVEKLHVLAEKMASRL